MTDLERQLLHVTTLLSRLQAAVEQLAATVLADRTVVVPLRGETRDETPGGAA